MNIKIGLDSIVDLNYLCYVIDRIHTDILQGEFLKERRHSRHLFCHLRFNRRRFIKVTIFHASFNNCMIIFFDLIKGGWDKWK